MSIQKIAECKQFPTFLRFNLTALTTTQRGRKAQEMSPKPPSTRPPFALHLQLAVQAF